ncbi:succinate semialdehyde dehydrogenase NADP+ linked [Actinomortierella ambigua]|uniref:Succinate-semialdehyde dehydrogenase, mitochondrial n=1 Tax=Actinomortierella ambigua TaxID=1343610 RepID=A0A9P6U4M5_9FUNG|nr:succinate semialdehyde dehydrogenase NADP+ linked [Actinomortierella ambigua]
MSRSMLSLRAFASMTGAARATAARVPSRVIRTTLPRSSPLPLLSAGVSLRAAVAARSLTRISATVGWIHQRQYSSAFDSSGHLKLNDPALLQAGGFINGQFIRTSATGIQFPVYDPARGVQIGSFPDMNAHETEQAIQAAKKAFPEWSQLTARERGAKLRKWFNLMVEHEQDLARIVTWENGKPLAEALGEVRYGASFIEWFAEEGRRMYGEVIPSPNKQQRMMAIRQPIGVVGVITPWNFPNAMITRKLGAALAVGCTTVIKPAHETPYSCLALCELANRAGIPAGVLNVVTTHAHTEAIGYSLTSSHDVQGISFTGSTAVGKHLLRASADTVKKVSLELGGNAAFIVFEDADLERAVEGAVLAKFRASGQTCVCSNRFFVHASVADRFAELLAARVRQFRVGSGFDPLTTHGPLIDQKAMRKVQGHVEDARAQGAKLLIGGGGGDDSVAFLNTGCGDDVVLNPDSDGKGSGGGAGTGIGGVEGGYFYPPTVLTGMTRSMKIAREETFGPVAAIFTFETEQEVIEAANDTRFGLASYFFSQDVGRCWRVAEKLQVGMVGVNTGVISTEVAPFGGIKESGIGREGARQGLDEYTQYKYINMAI